MIGTVKHSIGAAYFIVVVGCALLILRLINDLLAKIPDINPDNIPERLIVVGGCQMDLLPLILLLVFIFRDAGGFSMGVAGAIRNWNDEAVMPVLCLSWVLRLIDRRPIFCWITVPMFI